MKPSNNLEWSSDIYWRVQLVCKKVQAHSSLEPPLEYNQDQMPLTNQGSLMTFLTILGITEISCSFRLVLEGKTGKEIPESSRLEFLENNFTANICFQKTILLYQMQKTTPPGHWIEEV